jgi:FMN reductase
MNRKVPKSFSAARKKSAYNGTISGSLKNALHWLILLGDRHPPYLTGKLVGLISTAGGVQGVQAVNTMEFVVRACAGGRFLL